MFYCAAIQGEIKVLIAQSDRRFFPLFLFIPLAPPLWTRASEVPFSGWQLTKLRMRDLVPKACEGKLLTTTKKNTEKLEMRGRA